MTDRIYLDNAATSWPKPEAVYRAVSDYLRENGAAAGRSVYGEAVQAERIVSQARQRVAQVIGVTDPNRVILTCNGSDGLNLAIHGIVKPGDHVITTVAEHNSVLRPLAQERDDHGVQVTYINANAEGVIDPDDVRAALRPDTRLIAVTHASNVTGAIQPVEEVGRLARQRGVLFLLDAAQTLGHLPVDLQSLDVDLLAASGHKGLLGPLGTGILYVREGVEGQLNSLRQGGTGTQSEKDQQPEELPYKYEVGNLNVPALAGLVAGVEYLGVSGVQSQRQHELELLQTLLDRLGEIPGVQRYGPEATCRVGVVSLSFDSMDSQEAASVLDSAYRIQVRSGLHCAPRMHDALGTLDRGGTLRISLGPFTTADHISATVDAIQEIASAN